MIISKIINLIKKYYHVLFLMFLSSWILVYQRDGILSLCDFVFPVRPWISLYSRFFIWKEFSLLGHSDAIDFVNIIHYLPIALLNDIGLSIATIQSLFFIFLFFIASYSFYLLLYEILGDFKYKRMVAIIAANFYIFNPYVFAIKLLGYDMTLYIYSFVPLILFLFYKYLKTENYLKNKFIYLIGLCFLFSAPGNNQPAYISWIILVLVLYIIFFAIFKRFNRIILLKSFIVALLFILINLFWIIPSIGSGMFTNSLSAVKNINNIDEITSNSGQSLNEVFRFLGMSGFNSSWRGVPYFPYHQIYYSHVFIIIGFILLFIALLSCLFKEENGSQEKFWKMYFISIFLIAIFFIGGIVILFPEIKLWLYNKFAILLMYRKPYEKIGFFMIFSVAGLLAFSLKSIINWIESKFFKYKYKKIIIFGFLIFVLFLVNIYSFPLWTKQVFGPSNHKECALKALNYYPDYYYELGEYLKNNKKIGGIMGLPVNYSPISSGVDAYTWGYLGMDPIYSFISDGYVLFNPLMPFFNEFYEGINSNIMNSVNYKNNLVNTDTLFNVKGNILRNNLCWQLYSSPNPEQDKKYLENNFNKIASFGELDLFNISHDNFSPIFYTSSKINITDDAVSNLPEIISQPIYENRTIIYFKEQNKNIPSQLLNKSSVFAPLFNSADKSQKENRLVLNKYHADNIFTFNKINSYDPSVNVHYFPETQKLLVTSLPIKGIFINGEEVDIKTNPLLEVPSRVDDFLKIGENYFSIQSGYNKVFKFLEIGADIEVYEVKTTNKIELQGSSFEEKLWQETPDDCTNSMDGKADFSLSLSKDATNGQYSLELGAKNHYACVAKSIPVNLKKNKIYKYSFDYKSVKGNKISYYYNLISGDKSYSFSELITVANQGWNHYETIIKPEEDINKIALYFYAPSNGTQEIVNRYDNIGLSEVEMNLINTYKVDQNKLADSLIIKNIIKLKEGENTIEYRGDQGSNGALPQDLYNYYLESNSQEIIKTPILEFKRINPTKYRVIIHHAKENFPLVFSESFHDGWKSYLVDYKKDPVNFDAADYKILDGNEDDQANVEELKGFISQGYISSIGDLKEDNIKHVKWEDNKEIFDYSEPYKIDFISKNFQDTIQNDNLAPGSFYETWFKKPIADNQNHLMVNGYANSWNINPTELCGAPAGQALCVRNADGSYDLELVVEFWPQRLFYIGLFISGATLFGCLGYLGWDWVRRRKERKGDIEEGGEGKNI